MASHSDASPRYIPRLRTATSYRARNDYSAFVIWTKLRPTARGLRWCGCWPPPGQEHHAGPWDDNHWGRYARPVLVRARDKTYAGDYVSDLHSGFGQEMGQELITANLHIEAGYIDARRGD